MKWTFLFTVFFAMPAFSWTHLAQNIYGWSNHNVVISVNSSACTISQAEISTILQNAVTIWNSCPSTDLVLSISPTASTSTPSELINGTATDTPVIICDSNFSSDAGNAEAIPGVTLATQLDGSGHIIYSGVLLNAQTGAGADLSQLPQGLDAIVVTHEIGHLLGLGHSSDPDALMYFNIGSKSTPILTEDDMDGIAQLYPKSDFSGGSFGCSSVHRPMEFTDPIWLALWTFAMLGTIWLGRRLRFRPERLL